MAIVPASAPCFSQATAAPATQAAVPPNIPGPVTPPKLLSDDEDRVVPQCAGITAAEVKLEFVVTTEGAAKDIHVLVSPSAKHSACAVATIRSSSFLPAMRDGQPLEVKMVLTLNVKDKG